MSRNIGRLYPYGLSLILVCVLLPRSLAQTQNTGAIQGRVFDAETLKPIAGAVVTVTHEELGLERTTVTNSDGIYYVGILPPGRYKITATHPEYGPDVNPQNSVIRNFLVHITNTERADQPPPIVLRRIGAATSKPSAPPVSAAPSEEISLMVNLTNATRGSNFDARFLLSLPFSGVRTFDELAFLVAGVALPPLQIGTTVGPGIGPGVGTSGQFSINGLRSRSNNFTIDGSDNNDEEVGVRRQGFTSLVPQSIESAQEFQISTLLAEPQFGRNLGGQVNMVSRSGGKGYHGTLYGFLTDRRLRSRDPFEYRARNTRSVVISSGRTVLLDNQPLTVPDFEPKKEPYTRAQYGFALGGPAASQQRHFFVSFEGQTINASKTGHFAVPTVADRGLFGSGDKGLVINNKPTFPASITGNAFTSLFPFPNNPSGPYRDHTFTEELPASADGRIFSVKLDQNLKLFGRTHDLAARYNFTDDDTILPVTGEALFSSLEPKVRTQNLAISFGSALRAHVANQIRFSFGRTHLKFEEVRDPFLLPSSLPVPFLLNAPLLVNSTLPNTGPRFFTLQGGTEFVTKPLGQIAVSGFSPIGVDVFNFPQGRTNNIFQYADTLVYSLNKHRLTFGLDIRRSHLNSFLDRNFRPLAVFSGAVDVFGLALPAGRRLPELIGGKGAVCVPEACFYTGRDYLAAGAATGFFQTLVNGTQDSLIRLRYWQHDFFFSDQIRLRPNLSVLFGVRYELNTVPTEADRKIESTFDSDEVRRFGEVEKFILEGTSLPPVSGFEQFLAGRKKIFRLDKNNLAPHIALAWDPIGDGKTSIRAGYAIYYDQIPGAIISQSRNVFPRFLTINLGGFNLLADLNKPETFLLPHPFIAANPVLLFAVPGTLNQYDAQRRGDPVVSELASAVLTNFASGPGFILPSINLETPYAHHWGITIERQFGRDLLLSAGYIGTRGVHLLRFATPNLGPNAIPVVSDVTTEVPGPNLITPVLNGISLPPNREGIFGNVRPFPLLGSFTSIESDANSIYHSLQLQAVKRFSKGFQFTTAYTWSHAIDEVSDLFDLAGARALPQDSFNRRGERGDANYDTRHRFAFSLIWDLPLFSSNKVLGGWQLASKGYYQTGQPYSVLFCCDINLDGNLTDRIDPNLSLPGKTPRNIYRAPGVGTVDIAVNKRFKLSEWQSIEFRSEIFNLLNHPNYGIPVHQLLFGGYLTEPASRNNRLFTDVRAPMRTIQFALKYNF